MMSSNSILLCTVPVGWNRQQNQSKAFAIRPNLSFVLSNTRFSLVTLLRLASPVGLWEYDLTQIHSLAGCPPGHLQHTLT